MLAKVLVDLIASFLQKYELLSWLHAENLNLQGLCLNPNAIDFLFEHVSFREIYWQSLCRNVGARPLIEKHLEQIEGVPPFILSMEPISWLLLSRNPALIDLLRLHIDKINWVGLSQNPAAMDLLLENREKIDWDVLSMNPNAMQLLEANPKRINWTSLSCNPSAIPLLRKNREKINWNELSMNPAAIELLRENPDKINWYWLPQNKAAASLFLEFPEKALWNMSQTREAAEYLIASPWKIEWEYFVANPFAIRFLEEHQENLKLLHFSMYLAQNPAIFQPVVQRNVLLALHSLFSVEF